MINIFLLFCVVLFTGAGELYAKCDSQIKTKISHLAKTKHYRALGVLIRKSLNTKCSLQELKAVASQIRCTPLIEAVHATERLYTTHKNLCIRRPEFLQDALFILTELSECRKTSNYLTRKITGLNDTIEYDPRTKKAFILLDRYKGSTIGQGFKKSVCKAILFDVNRPKILARAEQKAPMGEELKINRKMQKTAGVINMRTWTTRSSGRKTITALYMDLYEPGSLKRQLRQKKGRHFTPIQVASIMQRLLRGLNSFHSKDFVHRDIHTGNCFVSMDQNNQMHQRIRAVIGDLGRTLPIKKAAGLPAQGAKICCPPEGFEMEKMHGQDYFASDIYAMGCVFYHLLFNKLAPWQGSYLRDKRVSSEKKQKILIGKLITGEKRLHYLSEQEEKRKLSPKEAVEQLILNMVQVDPSKRGTASSLQSKAKKLVRRLQSAGKKG